VLWVVRSSSGVRVVKFKLRNFTTMMITKYVAEKNHEALEPRSVDCMKFKAMMSRWDLEQ
jgi:hypothetical protein